MTLCSFQK